MTKFVSMSLSLAINYVQLVIEAYVKQVGFIVISLGIIMSYIT